MELVEKCVTVEIVERTVELVTGILRTLQTV